MQFCFLALESPLEDKSCCMLPPPFIRRMKSQLGPEYPDFEAALHTRPPVSVRWKSGLSMDHMASGFSPYTLEPVPWHPRGFYLSERPQFTLDPRLHAGAYYVQEAASMFLYQALTQHVDFSKPLKVLDLCAAPGGKTTLIADLIGPHSILVANEVVRARVNVLRENLEKWGTPNIAITCAEPEQYKFNLPNFFDLVVTDAPCSGEGLFRKDPNATKEWSVDQVTYCAGRQKLILESAYETLAPGGILVYSTCTYNYQENEENVQWLQEAKGMSLLSVKIDPAWGVEAHAGGYHFYPHKTRGEGFYLAILQKNTGVLTKRNVPNGFLSLKPLSKAQLPPVQRWLNADWPLRLFQIPSGEILALPAALEQAYLILDKAINRKWFGVYVGDVKGKDLIPAHPFALSPLVGSFNSIEVTREQALLFLKKEVFDFPPSTETGWTLVRYQGSNLGWIKVLPNRMNNYLPPERRIRMDLEKVIDLE
ncbi:MAG: RNA methyltransferase [Bacteroidetes bacterium]|nr:RNA methyltransferase [Bacteroidota bacterium]